MGPVELQRTVRAYLADGRTMEALVVAKKGAKVFPEFEVEFHLLLAEAQVARHDFDSAREVLEHTLKSQPNDQRIRAALDELRR